MEEWRRQVPGSPGGGKKDATAMRACEDTRPAALDLALGPADSPLTTQCWEWLGSYCGDVRVPAACHLHSCPCPFAAVPERGLGKVV